MSAHTPKTMSSRLMTMKFMQRSAAKSIKSEPSTPDAPPSKRMRMSNGGSPSSTPGAPSDHEIMQTALVAEEKKREEAIARAYEHTGETKWVLNYNDPYAGKRQPMMQVRQAGFAAIDANDDSDEEEDKPARMTFGGGLKKKKKAGKPDLVKVQGSASGSESEDGSESSSGEIESDNDKAFTKTPVRRPTVPLDEDMDLAGLTSLSGRPTPSSRDMSKVECFRCHNYGHMSMDCPRQARRSSGRSGGMSGGRARGRY